jgi:hypothetical protein
MMLDCAYIGDSIAVGLEQQDRRCEVHARVGASSRFIVNNYTGRGGDDYTVISIGSNDSDPATVFRNAARLRATISSRKVIWVLPYKREMANVLIRLIRTSYRRDTYVDLSLFRSNDNVHPRSYGNVSEHILSR